MTPKEASKENLERCAKIFITWQWGVTFISLFIIVLTGLAFANGVKFTNLERDILETKTAISAIENMNDKLDTILKRTR